MRAEQVFRDSLVGTDYEHIEQVMVAGSDVADSVLTFARSDTPEKSYDLIVIGATDEPLFKNLLVGNVVQKIARDADVTVIVVKRRSSPIHSFLRQTVLDPSTNNVAEG